MKSSSLQRIDIITLFPAMFEGPLTESLLGRARNRGLVHVAIHQLRDYSAADKHRTVDDRPFGGGAGMVLQADPIFKALQAVRKLGRKQGQRSAPHVIFLSPQGSVLRQTVAKQLARRPWLALLCGHYEGIDERLMKWIHEEISIGDYVLTGGELPAMVLVETVMRLVPGVVKEGDSLKRDSFENNLLDHPHYTRPAEWRGLAVPEVLLSGDHAKIDAWRRSQAESATQKKRPDLLQLPAHASRLGAIPRKRRFKK